MIIDGVCENPASARDFVVELRYLFRSKNRVPSIKAVRFVSTMFWISSAGVVVNRRDCVIPAQFTRTSTFDESSPLSKPLSLKFVVLQKSGDAIDPEIYRCGAPKSLGVRFETAVSSLSFEREIRVHW